MTTPLPLPGAKPPRLAGDDDEDDNWDSDEDEDPETWQVAAGRA